MQFLQIKNDCLNILTRMTFHLTWATLVILTISQEGWMYPTGPPDTVCEGMDPTISGPYAHEGGKQNSEIPYKLTMNRQIMKPGDSLTLNIMKKSAVTADDFKGFMVQGVNQESGETLGVFDVADDDPYLTKMTCSGINGGAVSHKSAVLKSNVTLVWKSPDNLANLTMVQFYFTVLANKQKFWAKKEAVNHVQVGNANVESDPKSSTESTAIMKTEVAFSTKGESTEDHSIKSVQPDPKSSTENTPTIKTDVKFSTKGGSTEDRSTKLVQPDTKSSTEDTATIKTDVKFSTKGGSTEDHSTKSVQTDLQFSTKVTTTEGHSTESVAAKSMHRFNVHATFIVMILITNSLAVTAILI